MLLPHRGLKGQPSIAHAHLNNMNQILELSTKKKRSTLEDSTQSKT